MSTKTRASQHARAAERKARGVATSSWMVWLARLGYAAKGVVYLIIGGLAVKLATGHGGAATDQRGALQTIAEQPFGKFLLAVVGIGLAGYALWNFVAALFDTEGQGRKATGIAGRVGSAVVGVSYILLAILAFQLVFGTSNAGQSSTTKTQDWTALLLKQPFGVALVVIVGLIVVGVAFYLFYRAYSTKFQRHLNLSSLDAQLRKWVIYLGRFGYAALGVVLFIIGIFLIVAAFEHNAGKAKGLDSALKELASQPFGPLLLGIVALGLVAYGLYSLVEVRYRRIP